MRTLATIKELMNLAALIEHCILSSGPPKRLQIFTRRSMEDILASQVGVFRAGCVTGPQHSGVELHGFLSHLVRVAMSGETYTIFGYKGKQVRDNIHSYDAVRDRKSV